MLTEIKRNLIILDNRAPFREETLKYISQLERIEWIHMNMHLDGSPLTKENIEGILSGEVVMNGRIMDHVMIDKLDNMIGELYGETKLEFLSKEWRRDTQEVMEYGYFPPLPVEIPGLFNELGEYLAKDDEMEDLIEKAANIHNRFIKMFPFKEENQLVARALMEKFLISRGFPMVYLDVSEETYNKWIEEYLKTDSSEKLATALEQAMLSKTNLFKQLTEDRD